MPQDRRFGGLKELFGADNIRQRLTPLLSIKRSKQQLQDDAPFVTLQVGKSVFDQAPRQMRIELWMSSLHKGIGVAAAAKYDALLQQTPSPEAAADIDKDLGRTFPNTKRFAAAEGQAALRRVLLAYAAHDPEVGYCQGLNFVAGLLLMYLPERHAFAALVVLMADRGLRTYYSTDMSLLQTHLWQLGRLMPVRLCCHLESLGVLPLLYGAPWLMTCFSADFPTDFSARVMDVIMADKMDQALLKASVGLLRRCEARLLAMTDMEECLALLKLELPAWDEPLLHDVLTEAFAQPWSRRQLALLGSVEGAETVAEAVERVRRANLAAAAAADGDADDGSTGDPSSEPGEGQRSRRALAAGTEGSSRAAAGGSGGGSSGLPMVVLPPPSPRRPSRGPSQSGFAGADAAAAGGGGGASNGTPAAAVAARPGAVLVADLLGPEAPADASGDWSAFSSSPCQHPAAAAAGAASLEQRGSHPPLIDMSSPTAEAAARAPAAAAAAFDAAGASDDNNGWDPFGAAGASSKQQQQHHLQPQQAADLLRRQLEDLSFSHLSSRQQQQHHSHWGSSGSSSGLPVEAAAAGPGRPPAPAGVRPVAQQQQRQPDLQLHRGAGSMSAPALHSTHQDDDWGDFVTSPTTAAQQQQQQQGQHQHQQPGSSSFAP